MSEIAIDNDFIPTLPTGFELQGEYRIDRTLGNGTFGVTYLATELMTGAPVVIKENYPHDYVDRDPSTHEICVRPGCKRNFEWSCKSFRQEAAVMRMLPRHPHLVQFSAGFRAMGTAYIVMQAVDGQNLHDIYCSKHKLIEPEESERMLRKLLSALTELHEREIIHRDIKPANIMCTKEGEPVLIDFGAARPIHGTHIATRIGTRCYAPPEQLEAEVDTNENEEAQETTAPQPHWDLYALGCTFHELITGNIPVRRARKLTERPELLSLYPSRLLRSIDKAHEQEPANRWQSAREWLAELDADARERMAAEQQAKKQAEQEFKRNMELKIRTKIEQEYQAALAEVQDLHAAKIGELQQQLRKAERQAPRKRGYSAILLAIICCLLLVGIAIHYYVELTNVKSELSAALERTDKAEKRQKDQSKLKEYGISESQYDDQIITAAQENNAEMLTLLIDAGADVNKVSKYGTTPLHRATEKGHTECVRLLLAAPGIDVNKADKHGETPLYHAAYNGHTECVRLLLAAPGIDVNKADKEGKTPLYWANDKCADLIRAAGGNF